MLGEREGRGVEVLQFISHLRGQLNVRVVETTHASSVERLHRCGQQRGGRGEGRGSGAPATHADTHACESPSSSGTPRNGGAEEEEGRMKYVLCSGIS